MTQAVLECTVRRSRKYPFTADMDALVRDAYEKMRRFGNRTALRHVRERIGYPKHIINRRARDLGLARAKEKPWSPAEVALLEMWKHLGLPAIRRKFTEAGHSRSETAINLKIKRLGVRSHSKRYWSANQIAIALGVDSHKVTGWIERKWLTATKRQTKRRRQQGGDMYNVHFNDLRRFLLHHPDQYDLAPVIDKYWFLHIVSGGHLKRSFRDELWADCAAPEAANGGDQ